MTPYLGVFLYIMGLILSSIGGKIDRYLNLRDQKKGGHMPGTELYEPGKCPVCDKLLEGDEKLFCKRHDVNEPVLDEPMFIGRLEEPMTFSESRSDPATDKVKELKIEDMEPGEIGFIQPQTIFLEQRKLVVPGSTKVMTTAYGSYNLKIKLSEDGGLVLADFGYTKNHIFIPGVIPMMRYKVYRVEFINDLSGASDDR